MRSFAATPPRPMTAMRRTWQTPKENSRLKLTKTLQKELQTYTDRIQKLRAENEYIKRLLHSLNEYKTGEKASKFLTQHFHKELKGIYESINQRNDRLISLEKDVKSTRVIFGGGIDRKSEKPRLLGENEHLVDLALFQEQLMIVEKLKLRMGHDLRDFCRYKKYTEFVVNGQEIDFSEEDDQISQKKLRISNLKKAIEYEKWRISSMQLPQFEINEAAKLIQKHWRGFLQRKKEGKVKIKVDNPNNSSNNNDNKNENEGNGKEVKNTSSSEYDGSEDEEESYYGGGYDDDSENGDDVNVFGVTGVTKPDRGSDEDDDDKDEKLAPADANDQHESKSTSKNVTKKDDSVSKGSDSKDDPNSYEQKEKNGEKTVSKEESEKQRIARRQQEILDKMMEERKKALEQTRKEKMNDAEKEVKDDNSQKKSENEMKIDVNGINKSPVNSNPNSPKRVKSPKNLGLKTYMSQSTE